MSRYRSIVQLKPTSKLTTIEKDLLYVIIAKHADNTKITVRALSNKGNAIGPRSIENFNSVLVFPVSMFLHRSRRDEDTLIKIAKMAKTEVKHMENKKIKAIVKNQINNILNNTDNE
ncbi:MAG: hypothetical protein KAH32_06930 [Chlamydiia bacterium]|nr:hypothetical protein [Chlamydiia bacterium]